MEFTPYLTVSLVSSFFVAYTHSLCLPQLPSLLLELVKTTPLAGTFDCSYADLLTTFEAQGHTDMTQSIVASKFRANILTDHLNQLQSSSL